MDYVLNQLRTHTSCCGTDDIYVEIFFTAEGGVADVRPRTGRNECYKQSLRDIILPTRWKVEGFRLDRPIYYEFRLSEECDGTAEDNVYKPVPPPGSTPPVAKNPSLPSTSGKSTPAEEKPASPEPQPIPVTPSLTEVQSKAAESPRKPQSAEKEVASAKTPPPSPSEEATPAPPPPPKKPQRKPTPPSEEASAPPTEAPLPPPGKVLGKEPPKEPQPPNPPALVGKLPEDTVPRPLSVPQKLTYRSTGEKRPPSDHLSSFANGAGPRFAEPEYINGSIAKAIYLKQEYRKRGVCGLVHVLLEVAIDAQGNVRGYRILRANRPDAEVATPSVLKGMKYKPVAIPMIFYTEFKIDVDCDSDRGKVKLDTVPDYLATPEGKIIRPPTPKP